MAPSGSVHHYTAWAQAEDSATINKRHTTTYACMSLEK